MTAGQSAAIPLRWNELLRTVEHLYRRLSDGGSRPVRAHLEDLLAGLGGIPGQAPPFIPPEGRTRPACAHLPATLAVPGEPRTGDLLAKLRPLAGGLDWSYGYRQVPPALAEKYAFAELIGPDGPLACDELVLGLVLFAPGCRYPDHVHEGVTESYVCLSGAMSENDTGVYCPGSLILNPAGHPHRLASDREAPCLVLYAWTGPSPQLRRRPMAFTGAAGGRPALTGDADA